VPFMLARHGIAVDVVAPSYHPLKHSQWVDRLYPVADDDLAFGQVVIDRMGAGTYGMLFVGDEPARDAIYKHPRVLELGANLPIPSTSGLFNTVGRKDLFHHWCEKHGIPTPKTLVANSREETVKAAEKLGLPCLLKRVAGTGGANSVMVMRNADDLERGFAMVERDQFWLVQEFVEGVVGMANLLADRGELLAWAAASKLACLSQGLGPLIIAGFENDPQLESICRLCANAGELHGVTGFDFIKTKDGKILLIDPHFGRAVAVLHFFSLCGVDFGAAIKDWLDGKSFFLRPHRCDVLAVKYPEAIEFGFTSGFRRLFREAPPFSRKTHYFFGPKGDWRMFFSEAESTIRNNLRIKLGAWRARNR